MGELSASDLEFLRGRGIDEDEAERQLECYRRPQPYARLLRPCTVGDGIIRLDEAEQRRLASFFDEASREKSVLKFVPASGAASRMFKALLAARVRPLARRDVDGGRAGDEVAAFFARLADFAFYPQLAEVMARDGLSLDEVARSQDVRPVFDYLLDDVGLGYAGLPKALLLFHRYPNETRTAFEEHLVEAVDVAPGERAALHFTVSENHRSAFEQRLSAVRERYEERYGVRYEVGFSYQRASTDTIAVTPEGQPFRTSDGRLLLRPSGHGALIENLAEQDADVVFVKNIDNVVPDHLREPTVWWKKVLGGLLLELHRRRDEVLDELERGVPGATGRAAEFLTRHLGTSAGAGAGHAQLRALLDRPLRVCGMVENTGEPGGGPFWIAGADGRASKQIVETSQIDLGDEGQREILESATHFNPVDLACAFRDRHGRPYDLKRFVDESAYLVVDKSHDGRPLRSLERPGLWNGAMADWNTVFVEVPVETFQPVKTVCDLLRPAHQPQAAGR